MSLQGNRVGPHLELRWETQGSSPVPMGILGFHIEFQQGIQASSCVEALNSAFLSCCKRGSFLRPPVEFRWELGPEVQQGSQTSLCVVRRYSGSNSSWARGIRPYPELSGNSVALTKGFLWSFNR